VFITRGVSPDIVEAALRAAEEAAEGAMRNALAIA
jgi:hypothetical protein